MPSQPERLYQGARETDRQTDRHRERRERNRQTDKHRDRQTETERDKREGGILMMILRERRWFCTAVPPAGVPRMQNLKGNRSEESI